MKRSATVLLLLAGVLLAAACPAQETNAPPSDPLTNLTARVDQLQRQGGDREQAMMQRLKELEEKVDALNKRLGDPTFSRSPFDSIERRLQDIEERLDDVERDVRRN